MSEPLKLIVLGCGSRGNAYAAFAAHDPDRARIVAVADPREFHWNRIGGLCGVPAERRYRLWTEVAALPKFADGVLICTQDAMHTEPAIAFARPGYHILPEKPVAPAGGPMGATVTADRSPAALGAARRKIRKIWRSPVRRFRVSHGAG